MLGCAWQFPNDLSGYRSKIGSACRRTCTCTSCHGNRRLLHRHHPRFDWRTGRKIWPQLLHRGMKESELDTRQPPDEFSVISACNSTPQRHYPDTPSLWYPIWSSGLPSPPLWWISVRLTCLYCSELSAQRGWGANWRTLTSSSGASSTCRQIASVSSLLQPTVAAFQTLVWLNGWISHKMRLESSWSPNSTYQKSRENQFERVGLLGTRLFFATAARWRSAD